MGSGYRLKCSKCGYSFMCMNGIGKLYPKVYTDTVQRAKDGELGPEIKQFFADHPDGTINAEQVTFCCDSCGNLSNDLDLTMYIQREDCRSTPSEEIGYVYVNDLKTYYKEYEKYPHMCAKCGGKMHTITDNEVVMCPKCKNPLESTKEFIMWD
jgi:DNA-directed RNA polymerase subunit M/transcription elongation factor TFIIS